MSQISTLVTGAGVNTPINLQWVPEFVLIGTEDTDIPVTGVNWTIGGKKRFDVAGQALLTGWSKYLRNGILGADVKVAQLIRIADGYYPNTEFQMNLTNVGVSTPAIYGYSLNWARGNCFTGANVVVQDGANQQFSGFVFLAFDPTNIVSADITFMDRTTRRSFSNRLLPAELASLFSLSNITDADGLLGSVQGIDNRNIVGNGGKYIESISLFASGAAVTVMVVSIDNIK